MAPFVPFERERNEIENNKNEFRASSLMNGLIYLFLSWFGLVALIRSIVNQPTIGPIVLFVGLMLLEECFRFLPARHYSAILFGLFPSIAGEN